MTAKANPRGWKARKPSAEEAKISQAFAEAKNYLIAQGELGGFELALENPLAPQAKIATVHPAQTKELPKEKEPADIIPKKSLLQKSKGNDGLWQSANNLSDFYNALPQHSFYQKTAETKFAAPINAKAKPPYLLLFHSPQELTQEAQGILQRLFNKLGIDLSACAISFFIKGSQSVLPREKAILGDMLKKEIELLNPDRIIIFRETPKQGEEPAKVDGYPTTIAGKQALRLYSLLEMIPSKEKMLETWNVHLKRCGWFG